MGILVILVLFIIVWFLLKFDVFFVIGFLVFRLVLFFMSKEFLIFLFQICFLRGCFRVYGFCICYYICSMFFCVFSMLFDVVGVFGIQVFYEYGYRIFELGFSSWGRLRDVCLGLFFGNKDRRRGCWVFYMVWDRFRKSKLLFLSMKLFTLYVICRGIVMGLDL